jgi:hypothetical protein
VWRIGFIHRLFRTYIELPVLSILQQIPHTQPIWDDEYATLMDVTFTIRKGFTAGIVCPFVQAQSLIPVGLCSIWGMA